MYSASVKTGWPPDFLCSPATFPVLLSATGMGSPQAPDVFLGEGRLSSTTEECLNIEPFPYASTQAAAVCWIQALAAAGVEQPLPCQGVKPA